MSDKPILFSSPMIKALLDGSEAAVDERFVLSVSENIGPVVLDAFPNQFPQHHGERSAEPGLEIGPRGQNSSHPASGGRQRDSRSGNAVDLGRGFIDAVTGRQDDVRCDERPRAGDRATPPRANAHAHREAVGLHADHSDLRESRRLTAGIGILRNS